MKSRGHKLRRYQSYYNRKEIEENVIYKVMENHRFITITHHVNIEGKD